MTAESTQDPIPPWQKLALQDLNREQHPHIRVSSSGLCQRALVYIAQGQPVTDPPNQAARNRMALGHMAEILIILNLQDQGWETSHTVTDQGQLTVEMPIPGTDSAITGHPDGLCRHPELTRNQWVTLECKSMASHLAEKVAAQGVAAVYPKYISQISLYAHRLHQMELVSHPHKGVFALMDRNGDPLPPERITWRQDHAQNTLQSLAQACQRAQTNDIPERPYPPDSFECRTCDFHTLCRGARTIQDEPETPSTSAFHAEDPSVLEAAETWLQLEPTQKQVKRTLQDASDNANKADIIAGNVRAGYFRPRRPPAYDPQLLEQYVPADILRKCLSPYQDRREGFWIRRTN